MVWPNGQTFVCNNKAQALKLSLPGDVIYEIVLSQGETV